VHANRVAEPDRRDEAPVLEAEQGEVGPGEDPGLDAQAGGNREHQQTVGDGRVEAGPLGELSIYVQWVEVP